MTPEKAAQKGSGSNEQFAGFGPNEWLVYEMYQQYLKDPDSVERIGSEMIEVDADAVVEALA